MGSLLKDSHPAWGIMIGTPKIADLPPDVTKVKLRLRSDSVAMAYLHRGDGTVESWILGRTKTDGELSLLFLRGRNIPLLP